MKVLILSVSTGQGHHQTAAAIEQYIKEQGHECTTLDTLGCVSPLLEKGVDKGYLMSTKYAPDLYGRFYRIAEKRTKSDASIAKVTDMVMYGMLLRSVEKYINSYMPDVIVCSHVFAATLVSARRSKFKHPVKTIGIITDFTIHPYWEDTELDAYVTASHLLSLQCKKKGMNIENVYPLGIPIQSKFSMKVEKAEARKMLGVENKQTILVMTGSMGYGNIGKVIKSIDELESDFQIICVCGRNQRAEKQLAKIETKHKVYAHGFVNNVNIMMDAADFIITKPGGLSVSESLAKGLPMILVNPIPGQEDRNLEFLLNNGLALAVSKTCPIDEAVYQLIENEWRINNLEEGVRYIGKPNSVRDVGNLIIKLGNENASSK